MRTWTSTLAAIAILAFTAPAGYAASAGIPSDTQSGPGSHTTRIIEHPRPLIAATLRIKNKKQAATIKTLRAANKALAARNKALAAANRSKS